MLCGHAVVSELEEVQGREDSYCEGTGVDQCVLWGPAVGMVSCGMHRFVRYRWFTRFLFL